MFNILVKDNTIKSEKKRFIFKVDEEGNPMEFETIEELKEEVEKTMQDVSIGDIIAVKTYSIDANIILDDSVSSKPPTSDDVEDTDPPTNDEGNGSEGENEDSSTEGGTNEPTNPEGNEGSQDPNEGTTP